MDISKEIAYQLCKLEWVLRMPNPFHKMEVYYELKYNERVMIIPFIERCSIYGELFYGSNCEIVHKYLRNLFEKYETESCATEEELERKKKSKLLQKLKKKLGV